MNIYSPALFATLLLLSLYGQNAFVSGFKAEKRVKCNETDYLSSNHTYYFTYTVFTESEAFGISHEANDLQISCNVIINAERNCRYLIYLPKCSITEFAKGSQNENKEPKELPQFRLFSRRMTKYPVLFSLSKGEIRLEAHKLESFNILNLKRGIISSVLLKQPDTSNKVEAVRSDVHGICPVTYQYINSTVISEKNTTECYSSRTNNLSYSPWSLFWNMSFIQKVWIDSHVICQHKLNQRNGHFESAQCIEEHSWQTRILNGTNSKFQVKITQTLKLQETTTLKPIIYNSNDFYFTTLHYEYGSDTVPRTNPPNLKQQVIKLMEALLTEDGTPITPESVNAFDNLIKLFRQAADLSEIAKELPTCWNIAKCQGLPIAYMDYNDYQFQIGQIWRDALVQCNRLPCLRALRSLLNLNEGYLEHVISDNYLNLVFLSWSVMKVNNVEYFTEMLEICKMKPTRPCILSLSSAVHTYWEQYKIQWMNKVPKQILDIVYYVADPIGSNCELTSNYNKAQIVLALKAITNLGEVAEMARPDIIRCLYACAVNDKTYWPIPVMAIQATKRFRPTHDLQQILLQILKNPKSKLDERVATYLILVDKYGDAELMKDIMNILKNDNEEHNLKTFILSNLKVVAKAHLPENLKLIELLSEARNKNPDIFHRNIKNMYVSKSIEYNLWHSTPYLEDSSNQFGYRFSQDILRNKETFLPYSLTDKLQLQLFGKKYDLYEVYSNSRGMMKSYEIFLSYFFNAESLNVTKALQSVMKVLNIINDKSSTIDTLKRFSYHVDDKIFQNLQDIRKDRIAALKEILSGAHDAVFTLKVLGEELGFTTSELVQEDIFAIINSWIIPPLHEEHPFNTARIKILEAAHQVPTLSGLQLTWGSEAFLHHQLKEKKHVNYLNFNYEHKFDFSGLIAFKNSMVLEIPYITNSGAETLNTLSTSFGAVVTTKHSYNDQTLNISVKIPRRSLQLISFEKRSSFIRRFQTYGIAHSDGERISTQWCSDLLVPLIGAKLCHNRSHLDVNNKVREQSVIIPSNSKWELTAEYDMRHKGPFEVNFSAKRKSNKTSEKYSINLNILDPVISNKFHDVMSFSHLWDKVNQEHLVLVNSPRVPYLNAKAKIQHPKPDSLQRYLYAEATILQNMTFAILFQVQKMQIKRNIKELKNFNMIANGRDVPVKVNEYLVNFTTPVEVYIWNYTSQTWPQSFVYDHILTCQKTKEISVQWANQLLPNLCGERQTAKIQLHHEIRHIAAGLSLNTVPRLSYNYLKTPTSFIELSTFYGSTPSANRLIRVNITLHELPTNNLVTFLNFYSSLQQIETKKTKMVLHMMNVTTPLASYAAGYQYGNANKTYSATLFFQKQHLLSTALGKPGLKSKDHFWQKPENASNLNSNVDVTLEVKLMPNITDIETEYYVIGPLVRFNGILTLSYNDEKITLQTSPENVDKLRIGRNLLLHWPSKKIHWNSHLYLENIFDKITFNTSVFRLPNYTYASYKLNFTKNSDNSVIIFTDKFQSLLYEHTTHLELKAMPSDKLILSIASYSPIWSSVKADLVVSSLKTSRISTSRHDLADTILGFLWFDGFQGTFNISGKRVDIIPSVLGKVHFQGRNQGGTIQIYFSNSSTDVYGIYEVLTSKTGAKFILCLQKLCNTTESSSDFFVGSLNFVVVDDRNIETTLVLNRDLVQKIESDVASYNEKVTEAVCKEIYDLKSEINKRLKPYLEEKEPTFGHWAANFKLAAKLAIENMFSGMAAIPNSLKPIIDLVIHPFRHAYHYILHKVYTSKAVKMTNLPQIYRQLKQLELRNRLPRWVLQTILTMTEEYFTIDGPNSEIVYQLTVPLPFYRPKAKDYFIYANPTFFRPLHHLKLFPSNSPTYRDIFYDSRYSRFALLIDPGNIYTFEGVFVHLHGMLQPQCSYLLTHDFENQKFTVYYHQFNLHFLFSDITVVLTPKGEISVNGTRWDYPKEHWNREIQLSRKENLVEVKTKYNLKVVCQLEQFYCIFYTNAWKFNQLIGLLGNNNDNPVDDIKGINTEDIDFNKFVAGYELTGKAECRNPRNVKDTSIEPAEHWKECHTMSNSLDFHRLTFFSPTFLCHDIVPPDRFQYFCGRCSSFPCVNIKAYLALCGASYAPVGGTLFECESCGQHAVGSQWEVKMNKNLEVIFVIDQGKISGSHTDYLKGIEALVSSIDDKFVDEGYKEIRYGLVGFRGRGFQIHPQQHTINSKLFVPANEFKATGIRSLEFLGHRDTGSDIVLRAVQHACQHYRLEPTAQHIIILITHDNPMNAINMMELHKTLRQLKLHNIVLNVFSTSGMSQLRQKRFEPSSADYFDSGIYNETLSFELYKSPYSVLASETNGALWPISHLQENNMKQRLYLDAVAEELATSMTRVSGQCKICKCSEPKYYQPQTLCENNCLSGS